MSDTAFFDIDGDTLEVANALDDDGDLCITSKTYGNDTVSLYFKPDVVRALRDHLNEVLPATGVPALGGFADGLEGDVIVALKGSCCIKTGAEVVIALTDNIKGSDDDFYNVYVPGRGNAICSVDVKDAEFVRPAEGEFSEYSAKVGDRVRVVGALYAEEAVGGIGVVTEILPSNVIGDTPHPYYVTSDEDWQSVYAFALEPASETDDEYTDPFVSVRIDADGSSTVSGTFADDVIAVLKAFQKR